MTSLVLGITGKPFNLFFSFASSRWLSISLFLAARSAPMNQPAVSTLPSVTRPSATGSTPVGSGFAREVSVAKDSSSRGVGRVARDEKNAGENMKRGSCERAGISIVAVGEQECLAKSSLRFASTCRIRIRRESKTILRAHTRGAKRFRCSFLKSSTFPRPKPCSCMDWAIRMASFLRYAFNSGTTCSSRRHCRLFACRMGQRFESMKRDFLYPPTLRMEE